MIKLRAKKMLLSGYFKPFVSCFLPLMLSAVSLFVIGAALYFCTDSRLISFASVYFGKNAAQYVILASATVIMCIFAFLFAKGKAIYSSYVRRKTTGKTKSVLKADNTIKAFRILIASLMKFLFTLAWGFAFLSPFLLSAGSFFYRLLESGVAKNMSIAWAFGSGALLFIGLFFTFAVTQRYSAWFVFLSEENTGVISAMQKSVEITEGQCLKIAFFKLSMLPWLLLCLLIIPALYIIPYYSFSVGILIRSLERKSETPIPKEKPIIFKKAEAGY